MGFWRKALISIAILGAWAGVGSALFVLVTPGEERVQAMLKVGALGKARWGGWAGGVSPALGAGTANLSPAGDARAGLTEPGRGGQDPAVSDGRSAGGSCHAGECDLEEELAEWRRRREVSVSRDLHRGRGELRSGTGAGGGLSLPGTWRGARAGGAAAG